MDDTPANLVALRAILDDLGLHLVEARSGEEALERLKEQEFAVVLLDVWMPGLGGFDTAKLIRADVRTRHTPVIFLTAGDIDPAQVEAGYALGVVDFLVKPLSPAAVRAKVRGFVTLFQEKQRARREAEQLRLIVQGTTDYAIFMLDPHGNVATWNAGAERLKGYRAAEIIGRHFSTFYPQDVVDRGWPAHELKVAAAEGRFEDEGWRVRKDGSRFWANVVITALRDEKGQLRGFSKVTRDLTERKQAEEALRRSEERFRHMVEGVQDYAIFMLDPHGNVATWNAGAERIKGYAAGEIIGRHFSTFYPQDVVARGWPAHELKVAAAEGRFEDEGWRVRKDGSQFWANVVITAVKDDHGRLLGFTKVTRDLTARKQAEETARRLAEEAAARQAAHDERERLRVTLASIGDAVISTDAEGRVVFLNPVAEELVGWRSGEAAGRALDDVFRIVNENTRRPVENPALRALEEGVVVGLANHTVLISKDGTERPIDDSAAPIRNEQGHVAGSILVFRDISERKQAEAALAGQKRALELLVHGAPLPDVLDALCGAAEEQARDRLIATVLLADDGRRLRSVAGRRVPADFARAVDGAAGGPLSGSAAHRGEPVIVTDIAADPLWADYRDLALAHGLRACWSTPILSSQGQVLGTFAVYYPTPRGPTEDERRLVDILTRTASVAVERRRAEAALRESEERFRQLADAMPQIVWTVRPDGAIDYLNRRWTEYTGLPQTAGNDGWKHVVHPDDGPPAYERWTASLASGKPFEAELRLRDRGKAYRWHLIRTVAVRTGAGAARWFGTATDIHDQKRGERTARFLSDASAALAVLVDSDSTLQKVAALAVPYFADWAAVDVLEADGTLRRVAVAHVDPAKVQLAHDLHRRFPPDPAAPTGAWNILRTGKAELVPAITDDMLAASIKDGDRLRAMRELGLRSYMGVPLVVRGRPLGVLTFIAAESGHTYDDTDLAVARDLASRAGIAVENSQLYRELREADRRKDEFLAVLAHELRNPLAPIRNGLQVLRLAGGGGEMAADARSMMERQLVHMVRLVDDLLDVSRISRNKLDLRRERVALATVIHAAVETSRPLIEQAGHTFTVTLTPAPVYLDADPVRLAQVFSNLLTNAAKYTEPGGRITLTAEPDGAEVVVRVTDTGLGIPAEALPRIFEMFSQVDRNMERAQGGLGIGLTLVRRLAEMHGGTVEAHSDGPGRGSEFVVRLPVLADGHQRSAGPAAGPGVAAGPKRRVLVVDDNQDAAESLGMMLALMGNEVRTAHDGLAAVEEAEAYRPDMILLDIGLPKLNGYDACRRIRERPWANDTVIVALTGWGQEEDRRRSQEAGFDRHLVKPVDINDLTKLLAQGKR